MTDYQNYLIEKSKEIEELSQRVQVKIQATYDREGSIQAQEVAMVTELHNRAVGMVEATGRVIE